MKNIFFVTLILSMQTFALPGISDGQYTGSGNMWTALGLKSTYTASLLLEGERIQVEYDYGTQVVRYEALIEMVNEFEFRLLENGTKPMGSGYCHAKMCHLDLPGLKAEESLFFSPSGVHRLGSMDHGDVKLLYSEKLELLK